MSATKTIYVSIGNSDDKLTQTDWSEFQDATHKAIRGQAERIHGRWASLPTDPWQNACWCVELEPDQAVITLGGETMRREDWLRERLAQLAAEFRQDSIAWAEATTEFIAPARSNSL